VKIRDLLEGRQIAIALIVGLLAWVIYFSVQRPDFTIVAPLGDHPDFKLKGISLSFYEGGERKWDLNADSADLYSDHMKLKRIDILFPEQKHPVTLKGQSAYYDMNTHLIDIKAAKGRINTDTEQFRLLAPKITWDTQAQELSGSQGIRLNSQRSKFKSGRFLYSIKYNQIHLSKSPELTLDWTR